MNLDEDTFIDAVFGVLRRYVFFSEEKDLEIDLQEKENINQYYLINNYSATIPDLLEAVSIKYYFDTTFSVA